ncbi:hypothetical protein SLS62_008315 [Diatrype stigma]|uniref:Uncharacterized protein n=1 Tax=Diatrype stigma TaxID=117547 RepID=A0AAN9ULH3_9PEZI
MSDEWFSEKLAPDGDTTDGAHPQEVEALKQYLRRQLDAKEAAAAITKPVEASSGPNEDLPRLWGLLADALIELPSRVTNLLVELLQAVEALPEPDLSGIEKSKRPTHGTLWRGLPGFGHQYVDAYQYDRWRDRAVQARAKGDVAERDCIRTLQVKKADVEARLAMAGGVGVGGVDISFGYECGTDALECNSKNTIYDDDFVLEVNIWAVAKWFEVAGARFRDGAARGEESWALDRAGRRDEFDLWKGGRAMSWERWSFWRDRLENLQAHGGGVKEAAGRALENMQKE